MTVNYVNLVCNYVDGAGNPITKGTVTFTPNVEVLDTSTDHLVITETPVIVSLAKNPVPTVQLAATDNANMAPSGWAWQVSPRFPGAPPAQQFPLPYSGGAVQYLSDLVPAMTAPESVNLLPLTGGTMTGPLILAADPVTGLGAATKQYVDTSGGAQNFVTRSGGTTTPTAPLTYLNPVDYGAKFDGSTDDSAALAAAQASASCSVAFPPATAAVAATVSFTQSGERIHGAGMYATTVKATTGLSAILSQAASGYVSGVTLEDMTIDGGGLANVAVQAFGTGIGRLTVRRCRFINFPGGAMINAGLAAEFVVEDCEAEGGGLLKSAFFAGTNKELDSVILRRNKVRWVGNGVLLGDPGSQVVYAEIDDNDFEMGWMHAKALFSGFGGTVTYTATGLADTNAGGGSGFSGLALNQPVRAMPALQAGTFTAVSGTHIADTAAPGGGFLANGVIRNHIVRSGMSFAIVDLVESSTTMQVREWLDRSTYLPVAPPAALDSYTVFGLLFLNRTSSTGTAITGRHGASGGGGGWYDLTGIETTTPANGTLYEVPPLGNYQIFMTAQTDKVQITNNRLRGGWSDQIEHFGTRAIITGNFVEDGNNYGCFTGAPSGSPMLDKSVIVGNTFKHNAIGLGVGNATDVEIGPNQYEDNGWGLPNAFPGIQVVIENSVRVTVTGGNASNSPECANTTAGLFLQGGNLAACKVQGFTGSGHTAGDVRIQNSTLAGAVELINVTGVITYQGTSNGQRLQLTGTGSPVNSLIASPGSTFLNTAGGSGTTLYVKETGTDDTGWTPILTAPGFPAMGNQAKYAQITSTVTQVLAASAWTAVTGAPSITLPNDGNLYQVTFTVSSIQSSTAENIYVGIGTSTTTMLATTGVNTSVSNPYNGRIQCQQVTGSLQTITVYGWATTGTPTLSLVAGGVTGGPCELAAYRIG